MQIQFNLQVSILKEGNRFIAYTPALDLSTSGKTHKEARERFEEAVQIFFEEISRKGTTDRALEELGWKKVQSEWQPPIEVSHESQQIKVPA